MFARSPNRPAMNPCVDYAQAYKRKDSIMKHLLKRKADPDAQHPADDPLWDADLTKYMMSKRPTQYDNSKKRKGNRAAANRYYAKRVKTQEERADELQGRYERGEIPIEEFQKVLIGNRRREFLTERRIRERLEHQIAADNEIKVAARVEERLAELRSASDFANSTDDPRLRELEAMTMFKTVPRGIHHG
jgi:hypothetical protein